MKGVVRNCVRLLEPLTFGDGAFIACACGAAYYRGKVIFAWE